MNSGKRRGLLTVLVSAVLAFVTSLGLASPAAADHITVSTERTVNSNWCYNDDKYERQVLLIGYFSTQEQKPLTERYFSGCYRIYPNGEVRTHDGAVWVFNGSQIFANGYQHGLDIAYNGVGSDHEEYLFGQYKVDGVQTWLDGKYYVSSSGEIFYRNGFRHLGEWSDWYEAGVDNGYAAAQRRLDACFNRIKLVNVEPKKYGPELTFSVAQYLPEIPAERVVIGFREISAGNRQPQIVSGDFPWCVKSWFRYTNDGPRLTLNLGDTYVLSYDKEGPYYMRYWRNIPGWTPKPVHNEDLHQRIPAMG